MNDERDRNPRRPDDLPTGEDHRLKAHEWGEVPIHPSSLRPQARPAPEAQADGDPRGRSRGDGRDASKPLLRDFDRSAGAYPPGSYGELNYDDELSPIGLSTPASGKGPEGDTRSDERIRDDVSGALERDGDLDASEIEVRVEQGEVTLAGRVSDRSSQRRAEDLIEDLPGVRQVHNTLRVESTLHGPSL